MTLTPFDIILVLICLALVGYVFWSRKGNASGGSNDGQLIQQQIDTLRSELQTSMRTSSDVMDKALATTRDAMMQTLKLTNDQMSQHLTTVNAQLGNVGTQLQNTTGQMGSRLDNAAKVIQDVQKQLGELGKATEDIKELGLSVSSIGNLLQAPKFRGGLGELLLEDLLRQVLPSGGYKIQYRFKSGEKVDAVIVTSGGMVPVDSKFPLENFRKFVDAQSDQERSASAKVFRQDVKKHIDDIAKKYILPDEGTFDFALMYIPAENIYYETIIKDERFDGADGLYSYATERRVVPVSPNSFYAHLRVIALGFKGLQVEANAKEIIKSLGRLGGEVKKFRTLFETLGSHLTNARNNYDKADKALTGLEDKLDATQQLSDDGHDGQLPLSGGS